LKKEWLDHCFRLSLMKADLFSGARKILETRKLVFYDLWDEDDPLTLADCGYTRNKLGLLIKGYLHPESKAAALKLWEERRKKPSYGSVGFTTYNHFLKNDIVKKSKRASVMGPCIQSVVITQLSKKAYKIDVFYRTTELFKKFPADLVFIRDILLDGFDFSGMEFMGMTCHFANVTIHPQYAATAIAHWKGWEDKLNKLREKDRHFFDWWIKWTARYLCDEHFRGIEKFAQAMKVKETADKMITGKKRKKLTKYLRDNHPGHRNAYVEKKGDSK